jgi:hypothetical protein
MPKCQNQFNFFRGYLRIERCKCSNILLHLK